jgi:hypothetical protein
MMLSVAEAIYSQMTGLATNAFERICKETVHLSYYTSISLEELRKSMKNTSQDSRFLGQDLKP